MATPGLRCPPLNHTRYRFSAFQSHQLARNLRNALPAQGAGGRVRRDSDFGMSPEWVLAEQWLSAENIKRGACQMAVVYRGRGLLESFDAKEMLGYQNSGFSVDAGVRIEARDRAALERLLCYCARPLFSCERLRKELPRRSAARC